MASKIDRQRNRKALSKFAKANALHLDKTPEAKKALRCMSDMWSNRLPSTTKGFHKGLPGGPVTIL